MIMSQLLEIDKLEKLYQSNHKQGKIAEVLPFTTHAKYSSMHWSQMIGELVKMITGIKVNFSNISESEFETNYNDLSVFIANQIDCENEDAREDLTSFIDQYLFNDTEIKTVHPFLFNFIAKEKSKNEESKYARFASDIFFINNEDIKQFFLSRETNDVLNETIVTALGEQITEPQKVKEKEYDQLLPDLVTLFNEDLRYLMKKPQYLSEVFPLFVHYYIFAYSCQIIYRFGEFEKAEYEEIIPFHYALEWESLRGSRQAANGGKSYKIIQDRAKLLFPHMHAQFQLSHIKMNESSNQEMRPFYTYPMLQGLISEQGMENEFLHEVNKWIEKYCKIWSLETPHVSQSLDESYKTLVSCINRGMNSTAVKKYSKNIENLGKGIFLKSRGSLGYVFNLTHEMTMVLITVCVKNERLPLKTLYEKFEERGITLDYSSKRELVKMLESHNLLDKKSDSGDAQYVKPIL